MVREGISSWSLINWEKCQFKVRERGIEMDKVKFEVIEQLPPPINVKGIRSFIGHAGFY